MRLDQFETQRSVGPHGFVKFMGVLIDVEDENIILTPGAPDQQGFFFNEANLNLDRLIAKAARTSYTHGTTRVRDDAKLIDYLMRHHHTSPFEMVEFKFLIRAPLFVVQQFLRHRTASVNQESARYSMLEDLEFLPEPKDWRKPGLFNKQGSQYLNEEEVEVIGEPAYAVAEEALRHSYAAYQTLLDLGVSRELARIVLPTATYTKFVWKIDLHNLLRFLKLRLDDTAQEEIRHYAMAILEMIRPFVPHTIESWENHVLNACTLSADELTVVREIIKHHYAMQANSDVQLVSDLSAAGLSASRIREFKAKLRLTEPS